MANTHQSRPESRPENTIRGRRAVKQFREMFGATQSDVAEDAGISQSKISLYESGFVDLTEKELQRLGRALDALSNDPDGKPGLTALNDGTFAEKYASWSQKKQIKARRSMRRQAKLTQIEVARETGIPPKKLRHWETGRLELSDTDVAKWQQVIVAATVKHKKADPWARLEVRIEIALEDALNAHQGEILDHPLIAKIMESFRRETSALEEQLAAKTLVTPDAEEGTD
jgi:transcriptional regulator with XRE-family HTH domain